MFNRRFVLTVSAMAVMVLVLGASTHAKPWVLTSVNNLTFSGPVALPGVVLSAGSYTFESGPVGLHPDIVRVVTKSGKIVYTGFTMRVPRPAGRAGARTILMGEAPAGTPAPIAVWYPMDSQTGHEFRYR